MLDHTINLKAAAASAASSVAAALFGQPLAVVLLAFAGACGALSFATPRPFGQACGFVLLSTVAGSAGAGGVTWALSGFPAGLAAFVIGIIAWPLLQGAFNFAGKIPEKASDKWMR